jgi:hypothetical protein
MGTEQHMPLGVMHTGVRSALILGVVVVLLLWAGASGFQMFMLVSVGLLTLMGLIMGLQRPLLFVAVLGLWYVFAFLGSNMYFPALYYRFALFFLYLDEFLALIVLGILLVRLAFRQPVEPVVVLRVLGVLVLYTLANGLLNSSGLSRTLDYMLSYFRFIGLFAAVCTFLKPTPKLYSRQAALLAAVLLLQFVFDLGWLLGVNPVPNQLIASPGDWAVGTMGLSTYASYLAVIGMSMSMTRVLEAGFRGVWSHVALFSICAVLIVWGSTQHLLGLAPVTLAFVWFSTLRRQHWPKIYGVLIMVSVFLYVTDYYNRQFSEAFHEEWYERDRIERTFDPKIGVYHDVARHLARNGNWLFGEGPGRFSSVVAMRSVAPLFARYFYAELDPRRYNPGGSIIHYPRTGVLSLVGDVGLIGFVLYAWIYVYVFLRIFRRMRRGVYDPYPYGRVLAAAWCGWAVLFAMLNVMTDYLNFSICPFLTWVGAGLFWKTPAELNSPDAMPDDAEKAT